MDHVPDDYLPPLAFATHSEDLDSEDQRPADFPFNSTFPPEYGVTLMSPQSYVQVSLDFSENIIQRINAF